MGKKGTTGPKNWKLVGGETITDEKGEVTMPPANSKDVRKSILHAKREETLVIKVETDRGREEK